MSRRHDPRRAKAHRYYDVADIARLYDVTVPTARKWRKEGLRPIEEKRPFLFAGSQLAEFIKRKNKPRQPLQPGQIHCVGCKCAVEPVGNTALVRPMTPTSVQLIGHCPAGHEVQVRVRIADLREKAGKLNLRYEDGAAPFEEAGHDPRIDSSEGCEE
jgi:hypothetical protein